MFDKAAYMVTYMQEYRKENKETVNKAKKNWLEKNKEYHKNYMREYRARKKEERFKNAL